MAQIGELTPNTTFWVRVRRAGHAATLAIPIVVGTKSLGDNSFPMTLPLGGVQYDPPPATLPADASPTLAAAQALWTALDAADAQAGGAATRLSDPHPRLPRRRRCRRPAVPAGKLALDPAPVDARRPPEAGPGDVPILIIGGGTGGVAAALAAARAGRRVLLTEETDWIGGQLTAQAVPPDENPWIETFGGTRSYRAFREGVRDYYRRHFPLTPDARANPLLNPGDGFVSRLCHEPRVALAVLEAMLAPYVSSGLVTFCCGTSPSPRRRRRSRHGCHPPQSGHGPGAGVRARRLFWTPPRPGRCCHWRAWSMSSAPNPAPRPASRTPSTAPRSRATSRA